MTQGKHCELLPLFVAVATTPSLNLDPNQLGDAFFASPHTLLAQRFDV